MLLTVVLSAPTMMSGSAFDNVLITAMMSRAIQSQSGHDNSLLIFHPFERSSDALTFI